MTLIAGVIHYTSLCYLDDPNSFPILFLFLYSLAVLCLATFVNLTYMSRKTELS